MHVHVDTSYGVRSGVTTVRNLAEPLASLTRRPDTAGRQRKRSAGPIVVRGNTLRDLDPLKDVALVLVGGTTPRA